MDIRTTHTELEITVYTEILEGFIPTYTVPYFKGYYATNAATYSKKGH